MDEEEKGNPTPIQSLGKFEEPNARCSQRKFMYPNIKFGHSLLDSHFK
ncbi:hypothetical protein psyc5s11_33090 [Clostridium gelidum]|uniref:Uncharacterized protein n=1 Tax=Clostridium gelidum TaxID=704125 RepID=A0ABN6IYS7_9CLOT|nr:hypothetical protein [Clostridium gelidum]BCZ47242.1 hypothetical protein psyc5s11_33090 [Clostridium gelidum]